MNYNYVLFSSSFSPYKYMYREIEGLDNVKIFREKSELLRELSDFEQKISKFYLHPKINKFVKMPRKNRWYYRALKKMYFKEDLPLCFIWHYNYYKEIKNGMFDYLKKLYPDAKHVFVFSDPTYMNKEIIEELKKIMDVVSVFDPCIAEQYGIRCFPNVYPMEKCGNIDFTYDLCFIGADRGRESEIIRIAKACKENGVRALFVVHVKGYDKRALKNELQNDLNVKYIRSKIPYEETVEIIKKAKCILELKMEPFHTCSLRIQEAVVLGKKLLTNNPNVDRMPCCKDSEWIQYYSEPEDINWEFIKNDNIADYDYQGEYGAEHWLREIARIVNGEEHEVKSSV